MVFFFYLCPCGFARAALVAPRVNVAPVDLVALIPTDPAIAERVRDWSIGPLFHLALEFGRRLLLRFDLDLGATDLGAADLGAAALDVTLLQFPLNALVPLSPLLLVLLLLLLLVLALALALAAAAPVTTIGTILAINIAIAIAAQGW